MYFHFCFPADLLAPSSRVLQALRNGKNNSCHLAAFEVPCTGSLNSRCVSLLLHPCQAPSASLCIAILSLHQDSIACGHQLIEHCCKPSQGLSNPEVDAGLLTDIMKQLLFSAKMMFVKAGRSQDLALCDR